MCLHHCPIVSLFIQRTKYHNRYPNDKYDMGHSMTSPKPKVTKPDPDTHPKSKNPKPKDCTHRKPKHFDPNPLTQHKYRVSNDFVGL